jgi:hypothetical protein
VIVFAVADADLLNALKQASEFVRSDDIVSVFYGALRRKTAF